MGCVSFKRANAEVLDIVIPLAFRHCVTDLSREHQTDGEKERMDRLSEQVWRTTVVGRLRMLS
jgi:hypothetical protein